MADSFQPIAPRPAPVDTEGFVAWVRKNLFGSAGNALTTVVLLAAFAWWLPHALDWLLARAVWVANADACQAARGHGACWGVIAEKYRVILFGRYPLDQQWRPELATAAMLGLVVASCTRAFWKPWLVLLWVAVLACFFVLMGGGLFGLSKVETDRWGGLPLTIMLATLAIVFFSPMPKLVPSPTPTFLPNVPPPMPMVTGEPPPTPSRVVCP